LIFVSSIPSVSQTITRKNDRNPQTFFIVDSYLNYTVNNEMISAEKKFCTLSINLAFLVEFRPEGAGIVMF